jgi:D-sedoheptulose 7-phosphate isomerase
MTQTLPVKESATGSVASDYLDTLAQVLAMIPRDAVDQLVELLLETRKYGRRLYVMGNGGSSATASHLICDLIKTARVDGVAPMRGFALADNVPLLTAWANDLAYEQCFAEQIRATVEPDDVVIAISASGNSPNIVAGLTAAASVGARTVALVGFHGGAAALLAELTIHVPCHDYGLVEDAHSAIGHAVTAAVRSAVLAGRGA